MRDKQLINEHSEKCIVSIISFLFASWEMYKNDDDDGVFEFILPPFGVSLMFIYIIQYEKLRKLVKLFVKQNEVHK